MFSNSGVIITVFLLASSCVPSSCGAALRGTADEKLVEPLIFKAESFDPTVTEALVRLSDHVVDSNAVKSEFADDLLVDEGVLDAHMEGDHLVFGQESFVLRCANEAGINPCGPGRACHDTDDGITCEDIPSLQGCPVGCAPNSSCIKEQDSFNCVCDEGFFRPHAFLGCVKTSESEIQL